MLNPYLAGSEWASFYYSIDYLNAYENEKNGLDRSRNGQEWAERVGEGATGQEAKQVLYFSSLDEVLNAISEGEKTEALKGNRFFKNLLKPANKPLLDYLVFSKKYEYYSNLNKINPWGNEWDEDEDGASQRVALKKEAAKQFAAQKDPWLKRRYGYQLMLMHRYDGEKKVFNKIYDQYFKDDRTSVLSDWALHHRAAMTADAGQQAYFYAMSFDRCPEKNLASYQQFDTKQLEKALNFAQTDKERAAVLAIFEVKNPGRSLANLQKVYALDPANRELPLLLVREIAKLEDWLFTDELTGMGAGKHPAIADFGEARWTWTEAQWANFRQLNRGKDMAYLAEVRALVAAMQPAKGGYLSADLLHLFTGHLFLLEKNGAEAKRHLEAISKKPDPVIADQQATEQVLLLLNSADLNQKSVQDELAKNLSTVESHQDLFPKGRRDFQALNLLVSDAFLKKGKLAAAFFIHNHALDVPLAGNFDYGTSYYDLIQFLDWRATEKDVDEVLALMEKKGKSPFEKYLTNTTLPSRNALLDLRGTISFRKNDLKEAIKGFSNVPKDFWQTKHEFSTHLVSDPFSMWSDSLHRGDFPATKTAFVQRMLDLENEAKANPAKAAEANLLLGIAWLNCTYGGKSWMMFSYGNSIGEEDYPYSYCPPAGEMADVYYHSKRAKTYLDKAKAATKDPEILCKVAFLTGRMGWFDYDPAKQDSTEWNALDWDNQDDYLYKKEMAFYQPWASQYKGTKSWEEMTSICPVLLTYFGK